MVRAGKQTRARAPEPSSATGLRFTDWEDYRKRSVRPAEDFVEIVLETSRQTTGPVERRKDFD